MLSRDTGVYEASFYVPEEDPRAIYHEYFNSPNTMFPVWLESGALATKDQVLGVFIGGVAKAYQVKALRLHPVFNDHLGEIALVVVTDPTSGGARAYLRDYQGRAVRFDEKLGGERGALLLHDASGNAWRVNEDALVLADDPSVRLDRIPTNNAFWFGWYSNHPSSLVYPRPPG